MIESGVNSLYYSRKHLFGRHGFDVYIFFNDRLIAGECFAHGRSRDQFLRQYREAEAAITKYLKWSRKHGYSTGPIERAPNTLGWYVQYDFSGPSPETNAGTRYTLHRHPECGDESMLALTVDDGRKDNECCLLSRYEQPR